MASRQPRFWAVPPAARALLRRAMSFAGMLVLLSAALPQAGVAQGVAQGINQAQPSNLSGAWVSPPTDNVLERLEGPFTSDWTGMPLNAGGQALAQSYSAGMLAEPERVC